MKTDKLFENIEKLITPIKTDVDTCVFDDIEAHEKNILKNKELYDAFYKVKKILETPDVYKHIQSADTSINVNDNIITIIGYSKGDVDTVVVDETLDTYVKQIKDMYGKTFNIKLETEPTNFGKVRFVIEMELKK